jgi:uncharacterized lipoprotein YbaY
VGQKLPHMWLSRERIIALLGVVLMLGVLLSLAPAQAQSDEICFSETGQCMSGRIRQFWVENGGLPVFGFPITPQRAENTREGTFQSQWFERARLELHPGNPWPHDVLLGRLGVDQLVQQGRDWFSFPNADAATRARPDCRFFPETGHAVCGRFLTAFNSYGLRFAGSNSVTFEESLALFGQPLSEPQMETNSSGHFVWTQWFERARFEQHPQNAAPFDVLFGRLGAEVLVEHLQPAATPTPAPPTATPGAGPGGCTPQMTFVRDVAIPNGSTLEPGARFNRIWRVRNDGTCYWDNFRLVFARGDQMGGPASVRVPNTEPGASTDITVPLVAPNAPGRYRGNWVMQADNGTTFDGLIVEIVVAISAPATQAPATATAAPETATQAPTSPTSAPPTATPAPSATPTFNGSVSGTVSIRERIALPQETTITVELVRISGTSAPATVIATSQFASEGRQPPYAFNIRYDPAAIDPAGDYAIQARIDAGEGLRFASTETYLVITQGRPSNVDLVLERAP